MRCFTRFCGFLQNISINLFYCDLHTAPAASKVQWPVASSYIALGIVPWDKAWDTIDWNVLLMLADTMSTVEMFGHFHMPKPSFG